MNEMNENKIPINDDMSDELKSAIAYLNEHNIGLDDNIELPEDDEEDVEDFGEDEIDEVSDVEEIEFSDDIDEEDVNTDEIDNLF